MIWKVTENVIVCTVDQSQITLSFKEPCRQVCGLTIQQPKLNKARSENRLWVRILVTLNSNRDIIGVTSKHLEVTLLLCKCRISTWWHGEYNAGEEKEVGSLYQCQKYIQMKTFHTNLNPSV